MASNWDRLVGTWTTAATHPLLPGEVIVGQATFEWLEDQQFLLQRTHYDHPDIPDGVMVTGIIDGNQHMHYFDARGIHREFEVEITEDVWRSWDDTPGFSQRCSFAVRDGDTEFTGRGELRTDGTTWNHDISLTYRKVS